MTTAYPWKEAPQAGYAVIGDPIAHSWSPIIQTAAMRQAGISGRYVAIQVPDLEFDAAVVRLKQLGYEGLNVTVPLKERAYRYAKPEPEARKYGVANVLNLIEGTATNTDAAGFLDSLLEVAAEPGHVLVLGAGGTARALVRALKDQGWSVSIWNRTQERAERLVDDLGFSMTIPTDPDPRGFDLILNTTSASLEGESLPIPWERADPTTLAYDVAYGPSMSPFLAEARNHGLRIRDGVEMLIAQAARSFAWWHGIEPDRDVMRRSVEHLRWT
ncbi:MAG: Shikimate dehydrogenase (NADP(+)) [Fimbriimonadaceae bacterium]|nr:Shikimate dehydrogenase (NADP(+)) [Fimbriimonadaceae bacterium]